MPALKWFRLAADQSHALAQFNLGVMYATGKGVPQNHAEAVKWYRMAADQGYALAQGSLGLKYESGLGVSKDFVVAHMWYDLAAAGFTAGDSKVRDIVVSHRKLVAEQMTPAQIAKAKRLAQEWLAAHPKK